MGVDPDPETTTGTRSTTRSSRAFVEGVSVFFSMFDLRTWRPDVLSGAPWSQLELGGDRDCIPHEERATSELPMMRRLHQVTANVERLRTSPYTDKNRCAFSGDLNRRMCRSRCRVGWWETPARLFFGLIFKN